MRVIDNVFDFLFVAEKIKRFEDSQWGTKQDNMSDSIGKSFGGKTGNLMSKGGVRVNSVSKRNSTMT